MHVVLAALPDAYGIICKLEKGNGFTAVESFIDKDGLCCLEEKYEIYLQFA